LNLRLEKLKEKQKLGLDEPTEQLPVVVKDETNEEEDQVSFFIFYFETLFLNIFFFLSKIVNCKILSK